MMHLKLYHNPLQATSNIYVHPYAFIERISVLGPVLQTYLSGFGMGETNSSSVSLQRMPGWVGVLVLCRAGTLCREIWTDWIDGPRTKV